MMQELNLRQPPLQGGALPAELTSRYVMNTTHLRHMLNQNPGSLIYMPLVHHSHRVLYKADAVPIPLTDLQ